MSSCKWNPELIVSRINRQHNPVTLTITEEVAKTQYPNELCELLIEQEDNLLSSEFKWDEEWMELVKWAHKHHESLSSIGTTTQSGCTNPT